MIKGSPLSTESAGRGADMFVLRLPDGLRDTIKANAKANARSMNAEIVARIMQTVPESERSSLARIEAKLDELLAR